MFGVLNTWWFNVTAYLVFIILFFQYYKLAVKNVIRDGSATIILQVIGGVSALIYIPFFGITFPSNPIIYVTLALACVFYAINDRLNTTVRKNLEVSSYSIISELSNVFLIVIGLTVFREPFVLAKILGGAIVLSANFLLIYQKGKLDFNKYTLLAILAQLVFSVAISIDIGISKQFNLPIYIFLTLCIPAFLIFIMEKHNVNEVTAEWNNGSKKYFLITGVSWGLAILFMLRSYQLGSVTAVVPFSAASVLLNVLVASVFFGEKSHVLKKVALAVITVVGVSITVLF